MTTSLRKIVQVQGDYIPNGVDVPLVVAATRAAPPHPPAPDPVHHVAVATRLGAEVLVEVLNQHVGVGTPPAEKNAETTVGQAHEVPGELVAGAGSAGQHRTGTR